MSYTSVDWRSKIIDVECYLVPKWGDVKNYIKESFDKDYDAILVNDIEVGPGHTQTLFQPSG